MLQITNYSLEYIKGKKVIDGLNLSVREGDIYAFVGRNGVGKTTTIKSIVGINHITDGDIELDKIDNDYVLIMDKNDNLFVVAYVSNGAKHINIETVESEENIERMANSTIGNNRSIAEAANHIRLNKNKYN